MNEPTKTPYRQAVVIDQDGNEQVFLAHYWRYHSPDHEEFATAEEAAAFLHYGEDYGNLASCCIVWPDGSWAEYDYVSDKIGERQPFDPEHCPPRQVSDNPP